MEELKIDDIGKGVTDNKVESGIFLICSRIRLELNFGLKFSFCSS